MEQVRTKDNNKKRILLVDDRLGFYGTAKFFEWKLNQLLKERNYTLEIIPERFISKLEFRLKTEPFDAILLDLDFSHNEKEEEEKNFVEKFPNNKEDIWKSIGQEVLLEKIRPNFPALPVIVFTSKTSSEITLSKATEFNLIGKASFFNKERLLKDSGWDELLDILAQLLTEYEERFKDKIEVDENRKEEEMEARNRDFMQTYLWQKLAETIYYRKFSGDKSKKIGVVFFDMDRMKKLNDAFGYIGTNNILLKFVEKVKEFIEKNKESGIEYEIGRFFRERGDEFLIIYSGGIDKDKLISHLYELKEHINSKEFQKEVFEILKADPDKYGIKITSSMGLFVFPDDLKCEEYYEWEEILEENKLKEFADKCYRQMTEIPLKLKDSAKKLGRNQICYYQSDKTNIFQKNKEYYSPRVIVKVEREYIRKLFEFIFGDLAFEFIRKEKCKRPVLISVLLNKEGKLVIKPELKNIERKEIEGARSYFLKNVNKITEIKEERLKQDLILNTPILREIHNSLFDVLRKIARELGNEQLFPREPIVDEIRQNFYKIKEEFILYRGENPKRIKNKDLNLLKEFYEGIKIPVREGICVTERKSNKEGKYKRALVVTLEINPVSYNFLISESGRNMMKFQNFFEGYIKGFAKTHPDGEYTENLIEIIYRDNPERKYQEKQKPLFVCRHSLFSPVDPIVYNELVTIDRVRLDFKFPEDEENKSSNISNIIQHISLNEAKKAGIIKENSPVDIFVQKYSLSNTFKIVIYNGSEMIGPSIQLAEAAGFLSDILLEKFNKIFVLDIFSGSSSTLIPICDRLKNKKNIKAILLRIDANRPREDLLKNYIKNKNIKYPYIEGYFDFENCRIKIGNEDFDYQSFFNEKIKDELAKLNKDKIDLTIADPPHIFSIPFLFNKDKKTKKSFVDILSEKTRIFIVYYAHKEQIHLCEYIRKNLKKTFRYVWRLIIAGEEMAVCTNEKNLTKEIKEKLKEIPVEFKKDYIQKIKNESS